MKNEILQAKGKWGENDPCTTETIEKEGGDSKKKRLNTHALLGTAPFNWGVYVPSWRKGHKEAVKLTVLVSRKRGGGKRTLS